MSYYFNGILELDKSLNFSPQGAKVSISVDTAADLPTAATIQTDRSVTPIIGSTAQVINESAVYTLNSAGTWIKYESSPFADVYTKTEVDTLLSAKADAVDVYTIAQVDTLLSTKADASSVYTQAQVDQMFTDLVGIGAVFGDSPYDLDNYKTPGIWRSTGSGMTANGTNVPAPIQDPNQRRGFRLEVRATSTTDYVTQIVYPAWNANLPSKYYIRHYRGTTSPPTGGWSNWFEYAGTDTGS